MDGHSRAHDLGARYPYLPGANMTRVPAAGVRRPDGGRAWPASLRLRLETDHLLRNALYLILSTGLQAALGLAFWILAARLMSPASVGIASSLISATTVVAYLSLLGLNAALLRFLPAAPDQNLLITGCLLVAIGGGAGIGLVYALVVAGRTPRLAFVAHSPAMVAGFALLSGAAAVNLITDAVFVARRKASYSALTTGVVGGVVKIGSVAVLSGTGAYGLFCASAGGFAAAAAASLILVAALGWRPRARRPWPALRPLLRFSAASYAGSLFSLLPVLVVPLIVLDRLGARAAAYYFIAFQIATVAYGAAYAVEQAFLAEGSHAGADWPATLRRSRRILAALCLPGCLLLVATAHWLLLVFGPGYSQHGTAALIVLAIAVIPIAAAHWIWTVLRLAGRLRALMTSSLAYASATCGLAWLLAPHGLTALAAAWPAGALIGAAAGAGSRQFRIRSRSGTPCSGC